MPAAPETPPKVVADSPPPFLGTWKRVYIFVLCYLAGLIAIFYFFARAFSA